MRDSNAAVDSNDERYADLGKPELMVRPDDDDEPDMTAGALCADLLCGGCACCWVVCKLVCWRLAWRPGI